MQMAARRSQSHSILSDHRFSLNSTTGIEYVTLKWSRCHSKVVQMSLKSAPHENIREGLTVSICEKIDPFPLGIWFFDGLYLMVKGLKMHFSCSFCEVNCTPWSVSKIGQSGVQSVTHLINNKKLWNLVFCGQNLFHVKYNHNPKSNGPLKFCYK